MSCYSREIIDELTQSEPIYPPVYTDFPAKLIQQVIHS